MKITLPLIVAAAFAATSPVYAQDLAGQSVSVDVGVGASYKPTYPGSDEHETSPWLIFRNLKIGDGSGRDRDGFSITPSFDMIGPRDRDDDDRLTGVHEIDRAYELGAKVTYRAGPVQAYGTLRKGFGGHDGLTGDIGAKYRLDTNDKFTLWAGLSAGYGDDEFNETYFGITDEDAARTNYNAYTPGGGFNTASASLEGRYHLTPNTSILGEVRYSRIIGDAADSPIVLDEVQPSVRLGIVRTLNFGF
ncbi:MipA/OmpV family protein [Paracoccus albus]|uniref:MipA/OmpV family protein n=1 Tax=Paracoccus albus TaxID=3017784 RepID=UPI0022EFE376|nr:MipA/OmpV family protein [Paracoccus albus]WBU61043.1 MipA/OmpV family protein [Paracoccus albus]